MTEQAAKKQFKVEFSNVTHQNSDCLRLLVNKTFPLTYTDSLYAKIATEYKDLSFFSYLDDIPVGGISCRIEPRNEAPSMYILILAVLPKYRRGQIATQLLDEALKRARADPTIKCVYLHTPIHNEAAIKFYEKNGFKIVETLPAYYKVFENDERNTAVVLELTLQNAAK